MRPLADFSRRMSWGSSSSSAAVSPSLAGAVGLADLVREVVPRVPLAHCAARLLENVGQLVLREGLEIGDLDRLSLEALDLGPLFRRLLRSALDLLLRVGELPLQRAGALSWRDLLHWRLCPWARNDEHWARIGRWMRRRSGHNFHGKRHRKRDEVARISSRDVSGWAG